MKQVKMKLAALAAVAGVHSALGTPLPSSGTNSIAGTNVVLRVPEAPWVSSITAGLSITRGNSQSTLFTAKYLTEKKQNQNEWSLGADGAYGESAGVSTANSLHGFAHYNYLFTERSYAYGNADALHDEIQDLHYQATLSPGVGYYFIKLRPTTLAGEFGPALVTERRGQDDETYLSVRAAEHFEQKISSGARFWEKVEFLPEVTKFDNYIVNAEVGVESSITKKLSLQVTLDDNYVNDPAAGHGPNDARLVSGISYKF